MFSSVLKNGAEAVEVDLLHTASAILPGGVPDTSQRTSCVPHSDRLALHLWGEAPALPVLHAEAAPAVPVLLARAGDSPRAHRHCWRLRPTSYCSNWRSGWKSDQWSLKPYHPYHQHRQSRLNQLLEPGYW
jgi:hypothetical protein